MAPPSSFPSTTLGIFASSRHSFEPHLGASVLYLDFCVHLLARVSWGIGKA